MTAEEYWEEYKRSSGAEGECSSFYFCDNDKDARELAQLVVLGVKRATASNAWVYEHEGEPLPKPGDTSVVTDFYGDPKCVIRTVRVDVVPFKSVTAEFAALEGEGDKSLAFWREAHSRVFARECADIGREFSEDMPVVCERFEVVYR